MPTMTTMPPADWRVLNALFSRTFGRVGGYAVGQLIRDEDVSLEILVGLERRNLIAGYSGEMPVDLADLDPKIGNRPGRGIVVRLTSAGQRKVVGTPANNVICMLGGRSGHRAPARAVRAEGEATDDLLHAMFEEGLLEATGSIPAGLWRRLPPDLAIYLTPKGAEFYPRG